MRNILLITIFISVTCFANELEVTTKIMNKISYILIKKNVIKVFATEEKVRQAIHNSNTMKSINDCHNADLIISNKQSDIPFTCKEKMVFYTKYKAFKKDTHAVGAFFWQKGRPNIMFRKNILSKYHITLPSEFHKYIE